jgi:hypothetical protein
MTDQHASLELSPDKAYGFAPDLAMELYDLLAVVAQQAAEPTTEVAAQRLTLLRAAALMDRLQLVDEGPLGHGRLKLAAAQLTDCDRAHGTGRGPIPVDDRRWELDPVGYIRQEYTQLLDDGDRELRQRMDEPGQ